VILPFNILISGTPEETLSPTNVVLRNRGDGTFENVSDIVFPLFTQLGAYNLALGDYDRDGGIDLLGAAGSNVIEIGGMLRNIGTAGTTWLQVELVSTESAPGGFGAKLTLTAGGRTQFREVHSSPFDSSFEHFGLGGAELVDSLVIEWPSGIVQTLHDVPVNQRRVVGEIASTCAEGDDDDADGVCAAVDNCLLVANGSADARNQLDSDGDGFGDGCDADLNGDGAVGLDDVATILRSLDATSGSALYDPAYDLDGNGWITEHDLHLVFQVLGTPPGPSGVAPSP